MRVWVLFLGNVMTIEKILAAIGAVIALLFGAFFKGRSDGKKEVKRDYDTAVAKRQAEVAKQVREVQDEVEQKTDDGVSAELKSRWVRK